MGYFILVSLFSLSSLASSCCGNSLAGFPVIFNKQRLLISYTQSYIQGQGRVEDNQYVKWSSKSRRIHNTTLQSAWSASDRLQFSAGVPLLNSEYKDQFGSQNSSILGDTVLTMNYESLPEFTYSKWKPNLYSSLVVILPTGRSVFESKLSEMSDVTGFNHFGLGGAVTAKKVWFPSALLLQSKAVYLFGKKFGAIEADPFWEYSAMLSLNYSLPIWNLSLGTSALMQYLEKRKAKNLTHNTHLESQAIVNFSPQLNIKKIAGPWTWAASFSDQRLERISNNTIINQSLALNVSYFLN